MKRRAARPVVITDAARSQEDQLRIRTIRYVVMMSIRVVCLVLAVVVVTLKPPLLGLWLLLCALGMTVIPWMAVVLANDRLPKDRHRWRRHRGSPATSRVLGQGADRPVRDLGHDQYRGDAGPGDGASFTVTVDPLGEPTPDGRPER